VKGKISFTVDHFQILAGRVRRQDFEKVDILVLATVCGKPESERHESAGTLGATFNEHSLDAVFVQEFD